MASPLQTTPNYEFTADHVPGWKNGNNRWVAVEILLSVIGLFVVIFMEWNNKEPKIAGKSTGTTATKKSEGEWQSDYVDSSEDSESGPPAQNPPNPNDPGRLGETGSNSLKNYDLIQDFWLYMSFHAVSVVVGMRHSAQGLGVLFAFIHFLLLGGFVFFHVNSNI